MPPPKTSLAKKTTAKKTAAKKTAAKKTAATNVKTPAGKTAAGKPHASAKPGAGKKTMAAGAAPAPKLSRKERASRPPSEQHRRAVGAVQQMFRLCPLDAARWIWSRHGAASATHTIVEALWIEQAPRGPAYVVPSPRVEEDRPPTVDELFSRVLKRAIMEEASKSRIQVTPIDFDFEEAARQTLVEGGSPVELKVQIARDGKKPTDLLLGVLLPDEHEKGEETPWAVLRGTSWHMLAYERITGGPRHKIPAFLTMPLYLWPGTGLHDPQENCSVFTGDLELPGILGTLLSFQDEKQRERERVQSRKLNQERLARQGRLDRERRKAAARRRSLTGDAGITAAELGALVPDIDVERDRITMIHNYDIVRLWEEPFDALLASLPPGCLGLSLFGHRAPEMSTTTALERAAFTLRRAIQGAPALEAQRAAVALASIGVAFLDPDEVRRLLGKMKLL